jgi:small redox-active disulfide protein 2
MKIIEIFGIGCENCQRLEVKVRAAVKKLGIEADIKKIEDFETIIRKGITKTPGLAIDGRIVSLGRVPSVEEIIDMINSKDGDGITSSDAMINIINPECGCSTKGTMIYPCSGGSNVGQISNEAAKVLVTSKVGKFACLAGVGSHGEGFISSAKKAGKIVVIDGCATRCAFKILQQAGIEPAIHLVVTDLGIKKDYEQLDPRQEDIDRIVRELESKL